jgi:single-strand DNA-binding protein
MTNKLILVGRLTADPELRTTPNGTPVCDMRIAVDRPRKRDVTDYFTITVWDKQGEACAEHLEKGRLVSVEARVEMRQWKKDGEKRTSYDFVAEQVTFLGGRRNGGESSTEEQAAEQEPVAAE